MKSIWKIHNLSSIAPKKLHFDPFKFKIIVNNSAVLQMYNSISLISYYTLYINEIETN